MSGAGEVVVDAAVQTHERPVAPDRLFCSCAYEAGSCPRHGVNANRVTRVSWTTTGDELPPWIDLTWSDGQKARYTR